MYQNRLNFKKYKRSLIIHSVIFIYYLLLLLLLLFLSTVLIYKYKGVTFFQLFFSTHSATFSLINYLFVCIYIDVRECMYL